jgi:hypothetical protein
MPPRGVRLGFSCIDPCMLSHVLRIALTLCPSPRSRPMRDRIDLPMPKPKMPNHRGAAAPQPMENQWQRDQPDAYQYCRPIILPARLPARPLSSPLHGQPMLVGRH